MPRRRHEREQVVPKTILTAVLLLFVAVSVAYLACQEAGLCARPGRGSGEVAPAALGSPSASDVDAAPALSDRVDVYYLHDAQRCATCLQVERMTRELLAREFAPAMGAGRLVWKPLVLEDSAALARRYDAASNAVVVSEVRGGKETAVLRLDDLWKFLDDPVVFDARLSAAIRPHLPEARP
jgi:hypothetical protein